MRNNIGKTTITTGRGGVSIWRYTPLLIALACIAAYYPALGAGFLSDDFIYLYGLVESSGGDETGAAFFRPLGIAFLQLDSLIWGESAIGFHLTNLFLHFIAAWGVAFCAGYLIREKWAAPLAGLVFALHPIHPEAVSWISGRFDVLCGALLAWSMGLYLRYTEARAGKGIHWLLTAYVFFALACLAKEMAFGFPFVMAALVLIYPNQPDDKRKPFTSRIIEVLPFFGMALVLFGVRAYVIGGIGGYSGQQQPSVGWMLYYVFIQPFYWLFLPLNRSLFRDIGPLTMWLVGIILVSPLALIPFRPPWKVLAFGAIAIFASSLPVAHIGYIDPEMQSSRFLYVPSIFFALIVSGLLAGVGGSSRSVRRVVRPLTIILLLTMLLTLNQNNFAWQEAGRIAGKAADSAVSLAENHSGEWGESILGLLVYNVPDANLGAYIFREGFETMLRRRTGSLLDGVEIELIIEEIGRFEKVGELKSVFEKGKVVWFFNDSDAVFVEVTEEQTLPGT